MSESLALAVLLEMGTKSSLIYAFLVFIVYFPALTATS